MKLFSCDELASPTLHHHSGLVNCRGPKRGMIISLSCSTFAGGGLNYVGTPRPSPPGPRSNRVFMVTASTPSPGFPLLLPGMTENLAGLRFWRTGLRRRSMGLKKKHLAQYVRKKQQLLFLLTMRFQYLKITYLHKGSALKVQNKSNFFI